MPEVVPCRICRRTETVAAIVDPGSIMERWIIGCVTCNRPGVLAAGTREAAIALWNETMGDGEAAQLRQKLAEEFLYAGITRVAVSNRIEALQDALTVLDETKENIEGVSRAMVIAECCAECADDPGNIAAHYETSRKVLLALRARAESRRMDALGEEATRD